jgi:hypothetical protein
MSNLLTYSLPLEKQNLKDEIEIGNTCKVKNFWFKNYYVEIHENVFDCSCLLLGYVEIINEEFQDQLEAFMHQNGYSKILFTIALSELKTTTKYTDLGYTCINTGRSARHPEIVLNTFLCYKIIDPKVKGYV